MARINSNIQSMVAQANLHRADADLQVRLQRLATGIRINRGADDPAGLIVSERLRSEIRGLEQAVRNSERASSVLSTTEASLAEVSDLLNSIKALLVEAANTGGLSDEERRANQLQIDSAIDSITRISNSASFAGLKLLNGELDYTLSGLATSAISTASVHSASLSGQGAMQLDVEVISSAQTAAIYLSAATSPIPGTFASGVTLEIAGPLGVQVLQIPSGQPLDDVVAQVNSFRSATGVSAALINASDLTSGMVFNSTGFGSASFVSVRRLQGPSDGGFLRTYKLADAAQLPAAFSFSDATVLAQLATATRDVGRDVAAIVSGSLAAGNGLSITVQNGTTLSVEMLLNKDLATRNGESTTFYVTGGGALYQLGGRIGPDQQVHIGLPSIAASRLGGTLVNDQVMFLNSLQEGGANDLRSRNFQTASSVLEQAIQQVAVIRGRLGAIERNVIQTNSRAAQSAIENLTASESIVRDADFAKETSALTRAQILSSTATSVLALANAQTQQVLQLLQ